MAGMDIIYLGIVGLGLWFAYSGGYLDKAGQSLVQATSKGQGQGQGYAKHHKHKVKEVLIPIVPVQPRIRLTMA